MYCRAKLVQLTVSRSDSELEMQRYGMKKNILWLLILSRWKMNSEWNNVKNRPEAAEVGFLKTELRKLSFRFFEFWGQFGSVRFLENRYPTFSSGSAHP